MKLRIADQHWKAVGRAIRPSFVDSVRFPPETGCILLVTENGSVSGPALLVNDVLLPETGDLLHQGHGSVTFNSNYLRRALLAVRERKLAGFLTLHTHPSADETVGFSWFDNSNDPALMANLYGLRPDGVFGSLVLGKRSVCGRTWQDGKPRELDELVIVGEELTHRKLDGRASSALPMPAEIFDRSLAITGRGALAELAASRIAIVGVSGTGSLMAELLARAGAGELVLFDFDDADESNLGRVLHLRAQDAAAGVNKATRISSAIAESGLPTRVTTIAGGDIRDASIAAELGGCDLLVGCVDRDWPRLILSEAAYQYLAPLVDLGTEIGFALEGIQSLDARVSLVGPGRPCLLCANVVTQERIRMESYSADERKRVVGMGYSKDVDLETPAVMDLNMRAASLGGLFVRHLFQPFLVRPLPHAVCETATNFSAKSRRYQPKPECAVCGTGRRLGAGSTFGLSTRPTNH